MYNETDTIRNDERHTLHLILPETECLCAFSSYSFILDKFFQLFFMFFIEEFFLCLVFYLYNIFLAKHKKKYKPHAYFCRDTWL